MAAQQKTPREAPEKDHERTSKVPRRDVSRRERSRELYINQIVLTQHPPQSIGVRNSRELITLGTGIDLLLQGRLAELGDLMAQRLKALETSLGEQGWVTARHQELIPP